MITLCNAWFWMPLLGYSLLLVPRLRLLVLFYIIYIKYLSQAHTTGTLPLRSNTLRTSRLFTSFASYFPLTLYRSAPLAPHA